MIEDKEFGSVIQLQGDKRTDIKNLLNSEYDIELDKIETHGF